MRTQDELNELRAIFREVLVALSPDCQSALGFFSLGADLLDWTKGQPMSEDLRRIVDAAQRAIARRRARMN